MENSLSVIRDIILNKGSLESVLDKMTDAFVFVDNDWKIIYWNQAAERLVETAARDVVGRNMWDCFPHMKDSVVHQQYQLAKDQNCSIEFEVFYPPVNVWGEVRAFPQDDGLAIYVKDITAKKEMEIELNRQRVLLSALMSKGADMVGIISVEGVYQFVSPNVERIFGYSQDELVGHTAWELIHPEDQAFVLANLEKMNTLSELLVKDFRFRDKEGNWRWVEVVLTNMLEDEVIQGLVINSREITERKVGEIRLLQAMESITRQNDTLKEIAFVQSHEFRRPVANILGLTELVQHIELPSEDRKIVSLLQQAAADLDDQVKKVVVLSQGVIVLANEAYNN